MQKIIVANPNIEQNNMFCQHLAKDKRLEIIRTTDGVSTLEKYFEIKPNILVLDSSFKDLHCLEIVDKLSINPHEKQNCNIILTTKKEEHLNISNVARIYKIIYYDNNCSNKLSETINEMYIYEEYEELTTKELNLFFLDLKIPLQSNGADYIREAIYTCYYYPNFQKKLKDIFSIIGKRHNKTNSAIRSSFRTALTRLNIYKNSIHCPIMKYFDYNQNITPKEFLEIAVMYFQDKKSKKK